MSRRGQHKPKARARNPKGFQHSDRLYHIYISMVVRCTRPEHPTYKHYGARGIKVCDEWLENNLSFFEWAMSNGYKEDLTLDRIDVNGDYSPNNCRWADWLTQNNNLRSNRIIIANGESHTLAQWSRITGLMPRTIANRIDIQGWTAEKALTEPLNEKMSKMSRKVKT